MYYYGKIHMKTIDNNDDTGSKYLQVDTNKGYTVQKWMASEFKYNPTHLIKHSLRKCSACSEQCGGRLGRVSSVTILNMAAVGSYSYQGG